MRQVVAHACVVEEILPVGRKNKVRAPRKRKRGKATAVARMAVGV